jgi:hypothetical protein
VPDKHGVYSPFDVQILQKVQQLIDPEHATHRVVSVSSRHWGRECGLGATEYYCGSLDRRFPAYDQSFAVLLPDACTLNLIQELIAFRLPARRMPSRAAVRFRQI